jgi:hypothetical protein
VLLVDAEVVPAVNRPWTAGSSRARPPPPAVTERSTMGCDVRGGN